MYANYASPAHQVPASVTARCDNASAGVLIRRDGRYLTLTRVRPPAGVAPVAGHIDEHGNPMAAARAEVAEEVGLTVVALARVITGRWRTNVCRRHPGPLGLGHKWTVYLAEVTGDLNPDEREARDLAWYSPAQLQILADHTTRYAQGHLSEEAFTARPGLEPVWAEFLAELHIIDLRPAELAAIDAAASRSPYAPH